MCLVVHSDEMWVDCSADWMVAKMAVRLVTMWAASTAAESVD